MLAQDSHDLEADWQRLYRRCGMTSAQLQGLVDGVAAAPNCCPDARLDDWRGLLGFEPDQAQLRLLQRRRYPNPGQPEDRSGRFRALREVLKRQSWNGFIVPRADEYQGEEIPLCAQRLPWLTGFQGSAGLAVVLLEQAALFVDGRYTLQARSEVDASLLAVKPIDASLPNDLAKWLSTALPGGGRVAYDPRLHTHREIEYLRQALQGHSQRPAKAGSALELIPCGDNLTAGTTPAGDLTMIDRRIGNPIDLIWSERPPSPLALGVAHSIDYAGQDSLSKRQQLAQKLQQSGAGSVLLTQPDSVAWLFNLRGRDLAYTPLLLCYALLRDDTSAILFVDQRKIGEELELGELVTLQPLSGLASTLEALAQAGQAIWLDLQVTPDWIFTHLQEIGGVIQRGDDPCRLLKAIKNSVEIEGARRAHLRDGLAWVRFLYWLDQNAPAGEVSELSAARKFLAVRQRGTHFRSLSFPTISAGGAHGAIVHYQADEQSDRHLSHGEFYLIDSGAQYLDGTTDATRTIAIGEISSDMRKCFTLVLKGHIALAKACFPLDTHGSQLDSLARIHLWQAGLDYAHGTGHGIGSYLRVHESPPSIAKSSNTPLVAGMILSNEPGYYQSEAYGIRLENLMVIRPDPDMPHMLSFETLTLAPIDVRALAPELLTPEERVWLDDYHTRVALELCPLLEDETAQWLRAVTIPQFTDTRFTAV